MIVSRWTHTVKLGRMEEAVALHLAIKEKAGHPLPFRIYWSDIGRFSVMAVEMEYESLAEYETFWAEWAARPDWGADVAKLFDLLEPGSTQEIWNLAG